MSAVWNGIWDTIKDLREQVLCKSMNNEAEKVYRGAGGCLRYCMAKEMGEDGISEGSTCLCDGFGKELRRDVGIQRGPVRQLVERQDQASRGDEIVDTLTDDATATTVDPAVETRTLDDGAVTTVTFDVPTATQLVVAPTVPASSVSYNTNAGIPSSTTGLVRPTATNASNTSSSQQDAVPQQSSDSTSGLSQSAKIGLGIGIGVGVPLLIALLAFLFIRRRKSRTHRQMSPKYETQGQSDLSMIETPHPGAMSASREPLHPHHDEVSKSFDSQQYQAYQTPPPPPINTSGDEDVFQTPISAVTRSELRTPTSDGRPMSRHIPGGPPILTIPEPDATPLHSRDASIDGGVSPVSLVSPVSAVSPVGSRAPSLKQQH